MKHGFLVSVLRQPTLEPQFRRHCEERLERLEAELRSQGLGELPEGWWFG